MPSESPSLTRELTGIKKIAVIVNPASGGSQPPLRELNTALADYDSTISVTQGPEDAARFCAEAITRSVDLVIVYGGDGSILETINSLAGTGIPLLILRGGTGNVIADELGLPVEIESTLALVEAGTVSVQTVDLGKINGSTFFALRCGCGLEVSALEETAFEGKSDWGKLAYAAGFLKAVSEQDPVEFRIWIDDAADPIVESGVALTVANAGRLGVGPLKLADGISMTDGFLDVCLIKQASIQTLMEYFAKSQGTGSDGTGLSGDSLITIQRATRIRIETDPPHAFQADGDIVGETPLEIEIVPGAAWMVVSR